VCESNYPPRLRMPPHESVPFHCYRDFVSTNEISQTQCLLCASLITPHLKGWLSTACYEEIYAADELEPGEIDNKRSRDFNACLQRVMRESQQKRRDEARAKVTAAVESSDDAESEAGGEDEDSPTPTAEPLAVEL